MVNNPLSHPWQTQVTKQFAAPRSEHVWSFQLQLHLANMNYNRNGSRQNGSRSTENDVDSAEATGLTRNLLVKQHGPWLSCFQYYSSMESRFLATDSPSLQYERENVNSFGFEPDAGFKERLFLGTGWCWNRACGVASTKSHLISRKQVSVV